MEKMNEVIDLLYKHIREELSAGESIQLQNWVNESEENRKFFEKATDVKGLLNNARIKNDNLQKVDIDQAWQELKELGWELPVEHKTTNISFSWFKYAVAAAIILLIAGFWLFAPRKSQRTPAESPAIATVNDAPPGQFKAQLTLNDGTIMILDSNAEGKTVQQGSIAVKNKDGKLVYEPKGKQNEALYNTLTTGKGETYATLLSDGTKIWLNSQSSVRYPVSFTGEVRKVEITGEAYFEVSTLATTSGRKRPFIVNASGLEVEVLGTHFNVNSYNNEAAIKTTLLEGKVKVRSSASSSQTILLPGEQAKANRQTQKLDKTKEVDVDAEVAWRYGYFQLQGADLPTFMRQLERWYDVQTIYEGKTPQHTFLGKIPRKMNLSQVLDLLQAQEIHFRIEGKKIIVSPE